MLDKETAPSTAQRLDLNATDMSLAAQTNSTMSLIQPAGAPPQSIKSYPIKRSSLLKFLVIVLFGGAIPSYSMSYLNQCAQLLNVKNDWVTDKQQNKHQEALGSIVILGMAFGAGFGGKIMKAGRRRALLWFFFVGAVGVSLSLIGITKFYFMLAGRFILGFCNGLIGATVPRYIEEYVPLSYYTLVAVLFCVGQNFGTSLGMFDGLLLPHEYNNPNYVQ